MTKKIISVILTILILGISVISFAATTQELNNQKNQIDKNIKDKKGQISNIEKEVKSVKEELEELNEEIAAKEDEIEDLTQELNSLNNEISELGKKLEVEQAKYDQQYDLFCKRLTAQYKMGKVSYLDVLLNSKSLTDFISRFYIMEKIAEYDNKLLTQIEEQKTALENSKAELEKKKSNLSEKQAKLKMEQINLSNKKTVKNKYVSKLTAEEQKLAKQIEELTEQRRQIDNELKRIAAEAARANAGGFIYSGGRLTFPLQSYVRVSSYFGYRGSAATGGVGSSYHKGIDFAASIGTNILTAEAGTVINISNTCTHNYSKTAETRCSCGGGYGNYIMISHGSGLVTLYAHCTSIDAKVGDTVYAGQKIGTVGTTGYSTGAHLHFSVILNGTYVNPAPYLGM